MINRNKFNDWSTLVGHDEVQENAKNFGEEKFIVLKSGRLIKSTQNWNPLIYAFVHDHEILLRFVEKNHRMLNLK
jgi:hypothetical protein